MYIKLPISIEDKQSLKVIANLSQIETVSPLKILQENLARDLHDDLSQYITTMSLYITGILSSNNLESAHLHANEMKAINSEMNYSLKNLLANLRSKKFLNNVSLNLNKGDFQSLINNWERLNPSVAIKSSINIPSNVSSITLSHCYQILKEALVNISRHANAKHVSVHIHKNVNSLQIKISDDGIGFKTTNLNKYKFGLIGMRERAKLIEGFMTLTSIPNNGTSISVQVPLDHML